MYLAGRDSDWFFLANNPERSTWPVFRKHYQAWCTRALRGEALAVPQEPALEQHAAEPLSTEQQLAALARLRRETQL